MTETLKRKLHRLERENRALRLALKNPTMTSTEYRALLDFIVCAGPNTTQRCENLLKDFADRKAIYHGYSSWEAAYHYFKAKS